MRTNNPLIPRPKIPEEIEAGRQAGAQNAEQLIEETRDMGLPAAGLRVERTPQVNDRVIRDYLLSIDEGGATKRVTVGSGPGGAVGIASLLATGKPAGLIIGGGMKAYGSTAAAIRLRAEPRLLPRRSPTS